MKQKQQFKKYGSGLIVFLCVFALACAIKIKASSSENMTGWLWGGADDGAGNSIGLGWISTNNITGGGTTGYGLNIPAVNGLVTGYAWSENVGWIDFAPTGPYPAAPNYSVTRNGNNLEGWARIVSIRDAAAIDNSGGWQGWVKMNGSNYQVSINPTTGSLNGNAWSDELGSISFSGTGSITYGGKIPPPPSGTLTSNVSTLILTAANPTLISSNPSGTPVVLTWTISDATSCVKSGGKWGVSSPNPLINPTTGNETVMQSDPVVTYVLTCTGPGGIKDIIVNSGTSISTICSEHKCGSGNTCDESFLPGIENYSECEQVCSVDDECKPLELGKWKEVAP